MRVVVSGAGGFIGRPLCAHLAAAGHDVRRLVRRAPRAPDEIAWDPIAGAIDRAGLEGADAVINLSGASLAGGRWTAARRAVLRESRTGTTALLARTLASLERRPRVLLSASAVGWYGDRGDTWVDESSGPGSGFLAEMARAWESAAAPAADAGIRVAHPRSGLVLDPGGGVLAAILPLFRLGLGGPLGNGRQWWSWIALGDHLRALTHALERDDMRGPFNAVSPEPVTCAAFARALGAALRRPALLPAPPFALRVVLGRLQADEMLLAGQRVRPSVLERTGFAFAHRELPGALDSMLRAGR